MLNILFLTEHSPFKTISGGHQRTRLICTAFSKFANIDVLTLEQEKESDIENCTMINVKSIKENNSFSYFISLFIPPILIKLTKIFSKNILGSKNTYLSKYVKYIRKNKSYDFIFVRYIRNLMVFGIKPDKSIILDIDDLPEQVYQSKIDSGSNNFLVRLFYSICIRNSRFYTRKFVKNVSVAYLANEKQCSLFKNAVYLPNIPYLFDTSEKSNYQIMFVGMIEYQPNYLGLEHFLDSVYPLVVKELPDVIFNIVGKISEERKTAWLLKYKNISILGFVDDLNREYQNCSLVVVPVYMGGGTNIKVLEAMSMSKACVITSFAARGFESFLENNKNIIIADNDIEFAGKILELLKNKDYRENIGKMAKETIITHDLYSFDNFAEIIKKSIPNK